MFSFVLFLQAIGQSYIVTAVQSMERQFQIPSKFSGFMVSASDIGYIPAVIFVSYFGSRGNRAKWLAVGGLLTGLAYLMIASPNFLFPTQQTSLNTSLIKSFGDIGYRFQKRLEPASSLLHDANITQLLDYAPIQDQIPMDIRQRMRDYLAADSQLLQANNSSLSSLRRYKRDSLYTLDEEVTMKVIQIIDQIQAILNGSDSDTEHLKQSLILYVNNRIQNSEDDILKIRRSSTAPFSFCNQLINNFSEYIQNESCSKKHSNTNAFVVILIALLILGVARTMPWSLGLPMVDDNVKRKSLPAYFAGLLFFRVLGPITGFLIGSFSNRFHYTLNPPKGLTAKDPTWIGAWWLGFLVIGTLLMGPSVLLYCFTYNDSVSPDANSSNPDNITNPKKRKSLELYDKYRAPHVPNRSYAERIKAFVKSYGDVLHSKVYLGAVLGRTFDMLAFRGYTVFLPKYLENHFGVPQYKAHQLIAMFGVFGFALGIVTGGYIVRKFKLNGRKAATYIAIVSLLNMSLFFAKAFIACNSVVNSVGIAGRATNLTYNSECNVDCNCYNSPLYPVCSPDGTPYFSPCHAGCRQVNVKQLSTYELEFSNCDCNPGQVLKKAYCQDDCKWMLVIFFITVISGAFVAGTGMVAGVLITIRSVPQEKRSLALGLEGFLISLLATLPSPMLWGFVYDSACLVWNTTCTGNGACAIYDPNLLRTRVHFFYTAIRFNSFLTDLFVVYHAKDLNLLDDKPKKPKNKLFQCDNLS
uniref:Solute carrier organic anion transporter family member n=1 Tax=Syphacia muris TaxID=451379 RepID=A0A0N5AUA4_9BILA